MGSPIGSVADGRARRQSRGDHRRLLGHRRGDCAGARRRGRERSRSRPGGRSGSTTSPSGSEPRAATRVAIETDVTDEEQANAFVDRTADELGGLDILVNNAGVMLLGPVAGAPTEQWRQMIDVNLLGLLYCTHAALPIMGSAGSGDIVNVASVAGRIAAMGSGVYNMTKWGVVGFSEALRQECALAGVRVTAIEPGWVDTELQGHNEHPLVVERMNELIEKIDKILEPEDIARAITLRGHPAAARQHQRDADPPDDLLPLSGLSRPASRGGRPPRACPRD